MHISVSTPCRGNDRTPLDLNAINRFGRVTNRLVIYISYKRGILTPRLNHNTTAAARTISIGIQKTGLASGLLLAKSTGGGRHQAPAGSIGNRMDGPPVGARAESPKGAMLVTELSVNSSCGSCADTALTT